MFLRLLELIDDNWNWKKKVGLGFRKVLSFEVITLAQASDTR